MRCPTCGTEFAPQEQFCGECGKPRPSISQRFVQTEQAFVELRQRYEASELDQATYEAEMKKLYLEGDGGYWMFDAEARRWNWFDGTAWVLRDPPVAATTPEPPTVVPVTPRETQPVAQGAFCPECGAQTSPSARFCISCGANLATAPRETGGATAQVEEPERKRLAPGARVSLPPVILTPLGWLVSWSLGWIFGFIVDPTSPLPTYIAIGGALGGLLTGWALQRANPSVGWKQGLAAALRFGASWLIGWIAAWAFVGLTVDRLGGLAEGITNAFGTGALGARVSQFWRSGWGMAGIVAGIVAGGLSGFLVGRLMRQAEPPLSRRLFAVLVIGLPVCWPLGWVLGAFLGAAIAGPRAAAIVGGIGAGACGLLPFSWLARAQRK